MQYFDRVYAYANGIFLGKSESIDVTWEGDNIPVDTLGEDLAGATPSPRRMMIQVNTFVPAAGFEFDAIKKWLAGEFITVKLQSGASGLGLETEGWVNAPSISVSTTDSTKMSFSMTCKAKAME